MLPMITTGLRPSIFFSHEITTRDRPQPEDAEIVRGDEGRIDTLWLAFSG